MLMIQELQDIFPLLTSRQLYKILLSIKIRGLKYTKIGLSRLEHSKYGISERQMRQFIAYLRNMGAIIKKGRARTKDFHLCNTYSISGWFKDGLKEIKEYIEKKKYNFNSFDLFAYIQANFSYKMKAMRKEIHFNYEGEHYYAFKGKKTDQVLMRGGKTPEVVNYYKLFGINT